MKWTEIVFPLLRRQKKIIQKNIIQSYLRVLPGCFATDSGFHRELKTEI